MLFLEAGGLEWKGQNVPWIATCLLLPVLELDHFTLFLTPSQTACRDNESMVKRIKKRKKKKRRNEKIKGKKKGETNKLKEKKKSNRSENRCLPQLFYFGASQISPPYWCFLTPFPGPFLALNNKTKNRHRQRDLVSQPLLFTCDQCRLLGWDSDSCLACAAPIPSF